MKVVVEKWKHYLNAIEDKKENVRSSLDHTQFRTLLSLAENKNELENWLKVLRHTFVYKTKKIFPITKNKDRKPVSRKCPSCENTYIDPIDLCVSCNGGDKDCRFADITKNVDIDKYVLKSSVPPCPDMSEYAKKYQIPPFPFNKDEWIRKNEIPPCPVYPNMYEYIKKSELQSLQCECGRYKESQCPIAPVCPICPEQTKVVEKIIYQDRPSSISQYSQNGGYWTPKLSEMTEGFNSNM